MKVEIQNCDSGDWVRVLVDGKHFAENHQVDDYQWVQLLERLGAEVVCSTHPVSFFRPVRKG